MSQARIAGPKRAHCRRYIRTSVGQPKIVDAMSIRIGRVQRRAKQDDEKHAAESGQGGPLPQSP
jgi:hypothetical protein